MAFKFPQKLKSRKFLLSLALGILVMLNNLFDLGLSQEEINTIAVGVISFIIVEGVGDAAARFGNGK